MLEADGSGDFPTIQAAIDAAVAGDTILLGPGVFDDYYVHPEYDYAYYVRITKNNLTIRGSGIDNTIIGQTIDNNQGRWVYLMTVEPSLEFLLEDLTLQLCDKTMTELLRGHANTNMRVNRVGFRRSYRGFYAGNCNFVGVADCEFTDIADEAFGTSFHTPSYIRNTRLERVGLGVYTNGSEELEISDCTFDGGGSGGNSIGGCIVPWSRATFNRCTFVNQTRAGILMDGVRLQVNDCVFSEGVGRGLEIVNGTFGGTGNIIYSENAVLVFGYGIIDNFRDNHLIAGGSGQLVRTYEDDRPPITVDMRYNWWGTDNIQLVAAGVWDHFDNPNLVVTVDYYPILGGPVYVEQRTWSDVKALFQ
jgi:hypothetical protein